MSSENKKKTLHFFNSETDIALANGSPFYTPPKQIVRMNLDLEILPFYYSDNGDEILLRQPFEETVFLDRLETKIGRRPNFRYLGEGLSASQYTSAMPWGWDQTLTFEPFISYCPSITSPITKADLCEWTSLLLPDLPVSLSDIKPVCCRTIEEIELRLQRGEQVVRAPLAGAGRGVRMVHERNFGRVYREWARGILDVQQSLIVSDRLDKVVDYSLQLEMTPSGELKHIGTTLFVTDKEGGYQGTLIATEETVRSLIGTYIEIELFDQIQTLLLTTLKEQFNGRVTGKFGIDGLIYRDASGIHLHPLVEVNSRRTMGSVAMGLRSVFCKQDQILLFQIKYFRENKMLREFVQRMERNDTSFFRLTPVNDETKFLAYIGSDTEQIGKIQRK